MQTLEELKNEELLNKKIRQKRRIRGVLIIVNALLIAYASYLSVVSIIDLVKENKEKDQGDVITLLDKSVDQSLELYDEYISNKVDVVDVADNGIVAVEEVVEEEEIFQIVEEPAGFDGLNKYLADNIQGSTYHLIDSSFGHDGFLVEAESLNKLILEFIN